MALSIEEAITGIKRLVNANRDASMGCEDLAKTPSERVLVLDKIHENDASYCIEQAEMQEQLVAWLEELQEYRRIGSVRDFEKVMGTVEDC
jgi:hypothetical protein